MDFIEQFDANTGTVEKIRLTQTGRIIFQKQYEQTYIKIIGTRACESNKNVIGLDFSDTVITDIKSYAFYENTNLETVILPPTIVTIENNAFRSAKITEITIPPSLISFNGAFNMCSKLVSFINDNNEHFIVEPEGIYNENYSKLIRAHANVTFKSISHMKTISSFGNYAFSKTNLDRFTSNDKISEITEGLFEECPVLFELDLILSPATKIGDYSFKNCNELKTVILPSNIEIIGGQAFFKCSLSAVFMPSSITSIAYNSFEMQRNLTRVYYFGLKKFDVDSFVGSEEEPIIYVPLDFPYETQFNKTVQRAKLNDMFIITNKCPKTNNCNNPFNKIARSFTLFTIIISAISVLE